MIGRLLIQPWPGVGRRRTTLAYTRLRARRSKRAARSARAPHAPAVNTNDTAMIFDQPPAELPVATLRPRERKARLWLAVRGWLAPPWRWFRPRAIPVAVAFAGLLGLYAVANHFSELTQRWPDPPDARAASAAPPQRASAKARVAQVKVATGPAGASVLVGGKPMRVTVENHGGSPKQIALTPGVYQVKLEPAPVPPLR